MGRGPKSKGRMILPIVVAQQRAELANIIPEAMNGEIRIAIHLQDGPELLMYLSADEAEQVAQLMQQEVRKLRQATPRP